MDESMGCDSHKVMHNRKIPVRACKNRAQSLWNRGRTDYHIRNSRGSRQNRADHKTGFGGQSRNDR